MNLTKCYTNITPLDATPNLEVLLV